MFLHNWMLKWMANLIGSELISELTLKQKELIVRLGPCQPSSSESLSCIDELFDPLEVIIIITGCVWVQIEFDYI